MAVTVEPNGPVLTITIARPDRRNAIDPATAAKLSAAFDRFEADDRRLVAVLTGAGAHFCAGFDLKALADNAGEVAPLPHDPEGAGPMGPTRRVLSKPCIAAVEGYAVAGGLELALWCDMRVVSTSAIFGVFCRRWGVPLIDGGTVRLPRIVGHGRAMDMILTGRPVDAEEAWRIGLADRVVPEGEARMAAEALAVDIARMPQACMRADRASAHAQWGETEAAALRAEARGGDRHLREGAAGAARFAAGLGRGGDASVI